MQAADQHSYYNRQLNILRAECIVYIALTGREGGGEGRREGGRGEGGREGGGGGENRATIMSVYHEVA